MLTSIFQIKSKVAAARGGHDPQPSTSRATQPSSSRVSQSGSDDEESATRSRRQARDPEVLVVDSDNAVSDVSMQYHSCIDNCCVSMLDVFWDSDCSFLSLPVLTNVSILPMLVLTANVDHL